jgi:raffinose/stachyose/melibiose transport system permease protein
LTASVSPPPLSEAGPSLPSEVRGGLFTPASTAYVEPSRRVTLNGWTTIAVFLPPALLLFTIFVALPMAEAAWYGFYNWDGYGRPEKFIGLKNYGYLIGNATFGRSLVNNGLIIAVSLLIQLPLALAIALMVAGRIPGAGWFRMIFFLPYILADVAAGLIWRFMFDGDYGIVGAATAALGMQPYFLLADKTWAFSAVLIVIVWKYFGFHMMLYVAGLQGIDRSLLEAAEMDGASAWQRFWHITLPLLGPMIRLSIFFSVVGALQLFDIIVPLTGGGPFETTNTMVSFLYYFGITRMRVGFGSAVGVVLFFICVTFAFGYRRIFMRDD